MKVTAISLRTIVYGSIVMLILVALTGAFVSAMSVGTLAYPLYGVLAIAWVIGVIRGVQSVNRTSVLVDADTVAWRTWVKPGKPSYASESGSVPMTSVARFAVQTRERTIGANAVMQHMVVLTLMDGSEITLPITSPAGHLSSQLKAVIDAFHAVRPPHVAVDTSNLDPSSPAAS